MKIEYSELPEFSREFKKLLKRFKTLTTDFESAKKMCLSLYHVQNLDNQCTVEIGGIDAVVPIFKLRKFACRALKGKGNRSGLRIIYSWQPHAMRIEFLEIYFKGDKVIEDQSRIRNYLKKVKIELT